MGPNVPLQSNDAPVMSYGNKLCRGTRWNRFFEKSGPFFGGSRRFETLAKVFFESVSKSILKKFSNKNQTCRRLKWVPGLVPETLRWFLKK